MHLGSKSSFQLRDAGSQRASRRRKRRKLSTSYLCECKGERLWLRVSVPFLRCAVVHTDSFNCACFFFQKSVCSCSDEREVLTAALCSFPSVLNVPQSPTCTLATILVLLS